MWNILNPYSEVSAVSCWLEPGRKRRSVALLASMAAHVAVLLVLCWPAKPVFLKPNALAYGEGGASTPAAISLYLPKNYIKQLNQQPQLPSPVIRQREARRVKTANRHNVLDQETAGTHEIGSPLGSAADGLAYGDEIKPALPVTFTDPRISRAEAPSGVQGDIIVEITIDIQGNVSETRLLQGLGYGIDQKVIAAAREWHFRPATKNGVAIPSKQDYRFHFPT
jgi:TonB family protein